MPAEPCIVDCTFIPSKNCDSPIIDISPRSSLSIKSSQDCFVLSSGALINMLAREFFISVYKVNSFSMSSVPYLRSISDKPCKYESFLHNMQF